MDDQELVDALDDVWRSIDELGAGLTEEEWKRETELPGWSVQDNLVHISAIESMSLGRPWVDLPPAPEGEHVKNDFGRHNEAQVHSRRAWTGAEALDEFRALTGERIDGLRVARHGRVRRGLVDAPGPGHGAHAAAVPDLRLVRPRAGHATRGREAGRHHVAGGASSRSTPWRPRCRSWSGRKSGPPRVPPSCSRSPSRSRARSPSRWCDGRAKLLDRPPADADHPRLTMSTITFERLGCGRVDPDAVVAAGDVSIAGDEALGRRVVGEMNYMF